MKTKQTKKYVAPKMELIEMEPREVLCESVFQKGGLMNLDYSNGQWGTIAP